MVSSLDFYCSMAAMGLMEKMMRNLGRSMPTWNQWCEYFWFCMILSHFSKLLRCPLKIWNLCGFLNLQDCPELIDYMVLKCFKHHISPYTINFYKYTHYITFYIYIYIYIIYIVTPKRILQSFILPLLSVFRVDFLPRLEHLQPGEVITGIWTSKMGSSRRWFSDILL